MSTTPKIKVSQLTVAATATLSDTFMVLQDGINKKMSLTTLLKHLDSGDSVRVNPSQSAINFTVASKNDANAIFVSGTSDRIGVGTATPQSKFHVNGNIQVGSSTTDGVVVQSSEAINYTTDDNTILAIKEISLSRAVTTLTLVNNVYGKYSLANGYNGQIKTITCSTLGSNSTITITVNAIGFNTITMIRLGDTVTLQYVSQAAKWCIISKVGFDPTLGIALTTV